MNLLLFLEVLVCFFSSSFTCPYGFFKIGNMKECEPWLSCEEISTLVVLEQIGFGTLKNVSKCTWYDEVLACNFLAAPELKDEFLSGLAMMKSMNPNPYVIQLVGYCPDKNVIVTEYHKFNNAIRVKNYLDLLKIDTIQTRLFLCYSYAKILELLHSGEFGVRINCDSTSLYKLLSQLLVADNFRLVLNDLDALEEVPKNGTAVCGTREINSDFAAPEQLWRQPGPFKIELMPGYDEKSDIWKLPDVCNFFLKGKDSEVAQYLLYDMHKKCKSASPRDRPTAKEMAKTYANVFREVTF